ncbi:hypothetical protein ABKN59_001464 [Abortiporus biennis]
MSLVAQCLRTARSPSHFVGRRTYASFTDLPRPPPYKQPEPEIFSAPSRPREYYARPKPRDLPPLQRKWPLLLFTSLIGVSIWGGFYLYAANQERLSSSVVKQIMATVKESEELKAVLGEGIRFEPAWYLNGDPWINGSNHTLQGNVDLSFRLKGSKNTGTLYFTSIRKAKGEPFTIIRFKVITDSGDVVNVPVTSLS